MLNIRSSNPVSPRTDPKRRGPSLQVSRSKTINPTPVLHKRASSVPPAKCVLCEKKIFRNNDHQYFSNIVHKSLYNKYASSQNYYYTKELNDLLSDSRTPMSIRLKDFQCLDDSDEYLKRYYKCSEYEPKVKLLTEYYKFHWDIPRLFMVPITEVINRYHDRKRRLQYLKVTKMLKDQKESQIPPPAKPNNDNKPKQDDQKQKPIADPVLVGLETSHSLLKGSKGDLDEKGDLMKKVQGQITSRRNNDILIQDNVQVPEKRIHREYLKNKGEPLKKEILRDQKAKKEPESLKNLKDVSVSNTIQDLNVKLGEIIAASESRVFDVNYFDITDQNLNDTISGLKGFLNFMKTTPEKTFETVRPLSGINRVAQNTQNTSRPLATLNTQRSSINKPATPRQEKMIPDNSPYERKQSNNNAIITWSRADSVPLITPVVSETAKKDHAIAGTKQTDHEGARTIKLVASGRVSSESLSSTMTSKSKSITKIRNFDEAVKISQQNSPQNRPENPNENGAFGGANKKEDLMIMIPKKIQDLEPLNCSPADSINKNTDSIGKSNWNHWDERSKDSSPTSKPNSRLLSPVVVKSSSTKLIGNKSPNQNHLKPIEKNTDPINPQLRAKSHRELALALEKNPLQTPTTSLKQAIQVQMTARAGHTRYGSGTFASPTNKNTLIKSGSGAQLPGRDFKNFMTLGPLEVQQYKEIKNMPNSARRENVVSRPGEPRTATDYNVTPTTTKQSEIVLVSDREKDSMPMSPKIPTTPRKFVYHKHTKSEGKLAIDPAVLAKMSEQQQQPKNKELMRHGSMNDAIEDVFGEIGQKSLKRSQEFSNKVLSHHGGSMVNLFLNTNRDLFLDNKSPTMSMTQRKQKPSELMLASPTNITPSSNLRSPKPDVLVKRKSITKKPENYGIEPKYKAEGNTPREDLKFSKVKCKREIFLSLSKSFLALSNMKGTGHLSATNFHKSPSNMLYTKTKGN